MTNEKKATGWVANFYNESGFDYNAEVVLVILICCIPLLILVAQIAAVLL